MREDVLFIGMGDSWDGVTHYRTKVPADMLGAMAIVQAPNGSVVLHERCHHPDPAVVVMQMPVFEWQPVQLMRAKREGRRVIVNIDDYLPAVPKLAKKGSHQHGGVFTAELQRNHLKAIELADLVVCATPWLAAKYARYNKTVVVRNGLDLGRYVVSEVERDAGVVVGWSGGTGHVGAVRSIAPALKSVVHDGCVFVCIGDDIRHVIADTDSVDTGRGKNGMEQSLNDQGLYHVRWSDIRQYPRDMAAIMVGVAPAEPNDFFRGKSQLRYYEAAALGIPLVADPMYDEVQHGITGFTAESERDWMHYLKLLTTDHELRESMSRAAKAWALSKDGCGIETRRAEWTAALGPAGAVPAREYDEPAQESRSTQPEQKHILF